MGKKRDAPKNKKAGKADMLYTLPQGPQQLEIVLNTLGETQWNAPPSLHSSRSPASCTCFQQFTSGDSDSVSSRCQLEHALLRLKDEPKDGVFPSPRLNLEVGKMAVGKSTSESYMSSSCGEAIEGNANTNFEPNFSANTGTPPVDPDMIINDIATSPHQDIPRVRRNEALRSLRALLQLQKRLSALGCEVPPELFLRLCVLANALGNHAAAGRLARRALLAQPSMTAAFYQLATALFHLGHPGPAAAALMQGLERSPDHPVLRRSLAAVLEHSRRRPLQAPSTLDGKGRTTVEPVAEDHGEGQRRSRCIDNSGH